MQKLIQILIKYLQPFRRKVIWLAVASLIAAATVAVTPMIYGRLVDYTLKGRSFNLIGWGLLLWLVLSLLNHWLNRIIDKYADVLSSQASSNFLLDLADRFLLLPFSYLKEQKIGKIISSIDRASDRLEDIIEKIVFELLPNFLTIVFMIFLLINIHWFLSLALIITLTAYIAVTIWKTKKLVKTVRLLNKSYTAMFGDVYESLSSYQTVKAFAAEKAVHRNLNDRLKNLIKLRWKNAINWNNLFLWQKTIYSFSFVGMFGLGIWLLSRGTITAGSLVTFVGYNSFVFGVLGRVAWDYSMLNRSLTEISQAYKLYEVKTELDLRDQNLEEVKTINGQVNFKNVSFRYPGNGQPLVLKNLNFSVRSGEVIALVGESGAGKSTLIDLICGYYLPERGEIFIDDYNTKKIDGQSLRRHIAIVPQEVSLFHETINFNIRYGKQGAAPAEIEEVAKAANAHEFILKFPKGYKSRVGERGVKLSVGQKQRIAIARALLRAPKILILDEATSSLDSITEKLVQEALERLIANRTTFVIAHRLSTIVHADRIFVLAKGEIAEIGNHRELLAQNGIYRRLYEAQRF